VPAPQRVRTSVYSAMVREEAPASVPAEESCLPCLMLFCPGPFHRKQTRLDSAMMAAKATVVGAEKPAPVVDVKAPVVETKVAAPVVEAVNAAPVVEAVKPAPVVEAEAAAPVVEAEKPAPVVEAEAAAPVMEAEKPAPVFEPKVVDVERMNRALISVALLNKAEGVEKLLTIGADINTKVGGG
jgi:hypothetical protein